MILSTSSICAKKIEIAEVVKQLKGMLTVLVVSSMLSAVITNDFYEINQNTLEKLQLLLDQKILSPFGEIYSDQIKTSKTLIKSVVQGRF